MNDLTKVEQQARALMTAHGVGRLNFRFSKAYRAIAACAFQTYRTPNGLCHIPTEIRLSKRWAMVLPEQEIWEVMIHEIAHALTANAGSPHGREFQAAVRKMGGKATRRCFSPSVNLDGSPRK